MPASSRYHRTLEFAALFVLLPLLIAWQGETMRRWIIPQLLLIAGLCLVLARHDIRPSTARDLAQAMAALPTSDRHPPGHRWQHRSAPG